MVALITGASSGIGKEMAIYLNKIGYDLILVARRKSRLEQLKKQLNGNVDIISMDISITENCMQLYKETKEKDIDILINNAGFGIFGEFSKTNLTKELELIDTNIKAVHILTKLFLKDFIKKDNGYILNVASSAAFLSGPLLSTYYASKGYVLKLTEAINEELRINGSKVYIGALCPGPVDTEFNKVANVKFSMKPKQAPYVAKYAIKKMFKKKMIIIPGIDVKLSIIFSKFISTRAMLKLTYNIQKRKKI